VIVRLNPQGIRLLDAQGHPFAWQQCLESIGRPGQISQWKAFIPLEDGSAVEGRICAIRKSQQATQLALRKLMKKVTKNGVALEPETVLFAGYVLVFTTLSEVEFEPHTILDWYRLRWQIELVFKRFKQIAQLGHLPKNDPESATAWLYGKLFVALLVEKLLAHANSVSPWGYPLQSQRSP
jgi:hypothetical protein